MPLAARLASTGGGASPYPAPLQPGYSSPAPGGYNPPHTSTAPQTYSRPVPPPPNASQYGDYGNQPSYGYNQSPYAQSQPSYGQNIPAYNQNQQSYGGASYHQGPSGGYGYGNPPPPGGQQGYGAPPPQQYGGPPQGQYGGGPPMGAPSGMDVQAYQRELEKAIQQKKLFPFYGPGTPGAANLPRIAQEAARQVARLTEAWRIHPELAKDIVRLALYDVVIFIDDSGSMEFEEGGERIDDLKLILERVAFAATLFDSDGIEVRFMNSTLPPEAKTSGIRSGPQAQELIRHVTFKGLTPFGTKLKEKVIEPILIPRLRSHRMQKPILIIGITDGQPAGELPNTLIDTVRFAVDAATGTPYQGSGHVAFQFAQVGNDKKATEFLAKIDQDRQIGSLVDCTSSMEICIHLKDLNVDEMPDYENESAEMLKSVPPVSLTPDLWVLKLILGAIDPSYDDQDENTSNAPEGQPGFGGPPQYNMGQSSGYNQGLSGGQPSYNQGQHGGQPPYNQGQHGGQPLYNQGQHGGQPPYHQSSSGAFGQNPNYGPPGGQPGYNRPPPVPPQGNYQPGPGYGAPQPPRY